MNFKSVLIFASGLGIGAGASYLVTKKILDDQKEAELNEMREYVKEKTEGLHIVTSTTPEVLKYIKETVHKVEAEPVEAEKETKEKDLKKAEDIVKKMDYNKMSTEQAAPKKKTTKKKTVKEPDIFVIEPDDFTSKESGYDKITLTYFENEEKFLDEYDEDFPDGFAVIGKDNLERMGEYEHNTLYVRNRATETDYEVLLETRTYEEYVAEEM